MLEKAATHGLSNLITQHLSNIDQSDPSIAELKGNIDQGATGLEYLLGTKRKKENTFYDEHPVQAVTRDVLNHSLPLAALGAIGTAGASAYNNKRHRNSDISIINQVPPPEKNWATELEGGSHPEFVKSFGRIGDNIEETKRRLDYLRNAGSQEWHSPSHIDELEKEYSDAHSALYEGGKTPEQQIAEIEQVMKDPSNSRHGATIKALESKGLDTGFDPSAHVNKLNKFKELAKSELESAHQPRLDAINTKKTNFEAALKKLKDLQDTSPSVRDLPDFAQIGEAMRRTHKPELSSAKPKPFSWGQFGPVEEEEANRSALLKNLLRSKHVAANPAIHSNFADYLKNIGGATPEILKTLEPPAHPYGLSHHHKLQARRYLHQFGKPALYGAAAGVGGLGLGYLLKKLQEKYYGPEKVQDWRKAGLRVAGKFDEADRLQ